MVRRWWVLSCPFYEEQNNIPMILPEFKKINQDKNQYLPTSSVKGYVICEIFSPGWSYRDIFTHSQHHRGDSENHWESDEAPSKIPFRIANIPLGRRERGDQSGWSVDKTFTFYFILYSIFKKFRKQYLLFQQYKKKKDFFFSGCDSKIPYLLGCVCLCIDTEGAMDLGLPPKGGGNCSITCDKVLHTNQKVGGTSW